jgi:glycosyltransferase involved in cell wall biosynthesis
MKKKILVRAPVLTRSGYGEHSRFVLRSLRTQEDKFDIYVFPVNWGKCGWIYDDNEERRWLDKLITKTAHYNQDKNAFYDISIQVSIPNEWERIAPINIGVTAGIETNRVAPVWLERANMMDKIITISSHSKNVFLNTEYDAVHKETGQKLQLRCNKPVEVVHYPTKEFEDLNLNLKLETDFNFLAVAQWGPRKNLENTVRWFVEEFIDQPVGLVVKTFMKGNSVIDRTHIDAKLTNILEKYKNRKCKVYLLHGDMTDQELHSLYKHPKIKAFVSLAHGEGFGLPHFEAAYSGLPVVAPEWSGYLDFLCAPRKDKKTGKEKIKPYFACVDCDLQPVQKEAQWDGVIQADSMWCFPQQGSYKMKLREVHKDYGRFKKQADSLKKWILDNFSEKKQYETFASHLKEYAPVPGEFVSNNEIDDLFNKLAKQSV